MGTTTSPQQHNPQTGAEKDPYEVLLSMLYTTKSYVLHEAFMTQFTTMSTKLSAKQILHQSQVLKDKIEHCCLF